MIYAGVDIAKMDHVVDAVDFSNCVEIVVGYAIGKHYLNIV